MQIQTFIDVERGIFALLDVWKFKLYYNVIIYLLYL